MDETATRLERGVAHHQAGELREAESLYRQILAGDPDHLQAAYRLGTALLQLGSYGESAELLERVAALRPDVPDLQNNLGVAYKALGEWEKAAGAFQSAVNADANYTQALFNLAELMQQRGFLADAEKYLRKLRQTDPDGLDALVRLAGVLKSRQNWADAEACYREALARDPDNLDVQVNLGFVVAKQEKLEQAAGIYREILAARPDYYQIHNSLAYVHERQGRLDEAVAYSRRALEIQPDYAEAYNNLGIALRSAGRLPEAAESFGKAVALRPDFPLFEFNLGATHLLAGEYQQGWPGYLRYCELLDAPVRQFTQPQWNGEPIPGGRLLVQADQGFGDTLQFARFLESARQRSGATVVLECQRELVRLLAGQQMADAVLAEGDPLPPFDYHVPLSHLPALFDVDLDSIPAASRYLKSVNAIRQELADLLKTKSNHERMVGLSWQGNPEQGRDPMRSCRLKALMPLADIPGIRLVSLQTGEAGCRQLAEVEGQDKLVDVGSRLRDFADTAAVLDQLELLVTVDTAVAHLAGAMGRPVWTLLGYAPDWRWHLQQTDSPWYAGMRLFRQPSWGDWQTVVQTVADELRRLVSQSDA